VSALDNFAGGLIVSCQAPRRSPLREPAWIARVAQAAEFGGAVGLRVNGPEDIAAVRALTSLPVIGLHKVTGEHRQIITPTLELAARLVEAGAVVVAVDATREVVGQDLSLLREIQDLGVQVMADISTLDEGLRAWDFGADMVGTTLSGYTLETGPSPEDPDLALVSGLAKRGVLVIAEGRYRNPLQVRAALDLGAHSVVVGGAITDPLSTTERFVAAVSSAQL
jgi:N-acylglucosamine-6-phosphate 2-epimerase